MDTHFFHLKEKRLESENLRMSLNEEIILLTAILTVFGLVSKYLISTFGLYNVIFGLGVIAGGAIIVPAIVIVILLLGNTIYDRLFYSRNK